MTFPPYPREGGSAARLYAALCEAGKDGLSRHRAACVHAGSDTPSLHELSQVGRYVSHLRPFLNRNDLDAVISAGNAKFAEGWRIVSKTDMAEERSEAEAAPDPTPSRYDSKMIGGQRISLPRLSCLHAPAGEARP